jgi:hypothetical protein
MSDPTTNTTSHPDSEARVALDLAKIIARKEEGEEKEAQNSREYWLTLYYQCRQATSKSSVYHNIEKILEINSKN